MSRSCMSLSAVSWEHLVIFAHLELLSFPSKSSNKLLIIRCCRWLNWEALCFSQNPAFARTLTSILFVLAMALSKHPRNHCSQIVISKEPFWVCSSTIFLSFFSYLSTHTIKPLAGSISPCKQHISNGSCNTAVSIIKWMYGYKP